jgi:hypothetical protein
MRSICGSRSLAGLGSIFCIAGFPVERGGTTVTDQGNLRFARPIRGDLMVPVRMEFGSEFGIFTAEFAELRGRGVDLRSTE